MTITCLVCQQPNRESERNCINCGASLRPALVSYYLDQAEVCVSKGQYEEARKFFGKADSQMLLLDKDERRRHLLTARAFWLQGSIYYYKAMWAEAEYELLAAQDELVNHAAGGAMLALVLNRLASTYFNQGRNDEAAVTWQHCVELAIASGDYASAAKAVGNIGIQISSAGKTTEIMTYYQQALAYAEMSKDTNVIAQMQRLLTSFYADYGPYALALEYAERSITTAHQTDDLYVRVLNLNAAANCHIRYGNSDLALRYLHEAYELTKNSDNKITTDIVSLSIGELMRQSDYRQNQEAWLVAAIKEFPEHISPPYKPQQTLQVTFYYIALQDWERLHRLSQQLRRFNTGELLQWRAGRVHAARVLVHAALGEWDEASRQYEAVGNLSGLSSYELAMTSEEYAKLLLNRTQVDPNPDFVAQIRAALAVAAQLYAQLEIPYACAKVEALARSLD